VDQIVQRAARHTPVLGRGPSRLLRPWEFDFVHDVFSRIIAEPWFIKNASHRGEFAAACMNAYQSGVTDPTRFHSLCEHLARDRHSELTGCRGQ